MFPDGVAVLTAGNLDLIRSGNIRIWIGSTDNDSAMILDCGATRSDRFIYSRAGVTRWTMKADGTTDEWQLNNASGLVMRIIQATGNLVMSADISGATASGAMVATQAQQVTGTAVNLLVTSGRQHFHKSAAKVWAGWNGTGTPAFTANYNCTSITDNGAGDWTINYTNALASANVCVVATGDATGNASWAKVTTIAAGSARITFANASGTGADPTRINMAAFGDMP